MRYDFKKGGVLPENITKLCKADTQNQQLTCTNVPIAISRPGNFTFELKAFSQGSDRNSSQQTQTKIKVLPKPLKIVYFKINGREEPSRVFKEDDPIILEWKVEGDKGTSVELSTDGTVGLQGTKKLTANQGLQSPIELKVTDQFGSPPLKKVFCFQVTKPAPSPTPNNTVVIPIPNKIPTPQEKAISPFSR